MAETNMYLRGETWWLKANVGGVQYRESLSTSDVREARRLRDDRLRAIREAVKRGTGRVSWGQAVVDWHANTIGQVADSTLDRYVQSLRTCGRWLNDLYLDQVDGQFVAKLIQARRRAGALPATINRDLTAISSVLTFAEGMNWTEGNATLSKRRLNRERRDPIRLPTEESFAAVLAASAPEFQALLIAARLTGARQAELVGLQWSQVRGAEVEIVGKGSKRRVITLSAAAADHFKSLPRTADSVFVDKRGKPFDIVGWTFQSAVGQAMRASAATDVRDTFVRFRFHDLRHLFAVEALRGGMGIYALSHHLGHSSVKTTEIYLTFLSGDQAQRARMA